MIESSIDIAQNHCSIEEFAITEITYLKYANDLLNSIKTKQMKMKLSHLSKLGGENKIEDDNFSDINHTHLDCFSLFNMTAKFKLINKLENDIELIEYYEDHLDNFKKFNDITSKKNEIYEFNEKHIEEINKLEKEVLSLFNDLNSLNKIKNNFENIQKENNELEKNDKREENNENEEDNHTEEEESCIDEEENNYNNND